jgi:PAS domain S-box-containing protein
MPLSPIRFLEHESFGRRLLGRLLPFIVFIGTGIATELILFEELSKQESLDRQKIISHAGEVRAILESELNATIHLASGLVAFIQVKKGDYKVTEIEPWLISLQKQESSIRNITLAPANRIQTIVPRLGNESAFGMYFPENKEQWPAVERVIKSKRPALAGPFALKQGGLGLAYRVPIFLDDGKYWGLVSTVLDAELVFEKAKRRAEELQLQFKIIDLDLAPNAKPLYGNISVKQSIVSHLKVNAPGRQIEIQAMSLPSEQSQLSRHIQRLAGWSVALLLSILIAKTFQFYRRQSRSYFALNESQQRFMRAFNTAPQGMALVDDDGHWISANPMLCQILGYKESDLRRISLAEIAPSLAIQNLQQEWRSQNKSSLQYELNLKHRDGSDVTCLLSLAHIDYEKLEKAYWIFQIIDINRRVAAERQIQANAEYTQAILNNVAEGIVCTTTSGMVLSINPAAISILKFPDESFLNVDFFQLVCGKEKVDLRAEVENFIQSFAANQTEELTSDATYFKRENSIKDYLGNDIHVEFSISFSQQKHQTDVIIVLRDISERKYLEIMQSEFVSIVSHELRTPLTSIIGSLKLIEGGIFGHLPDSLARMIHIALQNGQQLALIINDILDMDKLVAGKMEFNLQELTASSLVTTSIENNQSFARQYQITFEFDQPEQDFIVKADPQRVHQILSNLLSNAAKFSKTGNKVELSITKHDQSVKFTVKDYGEGIPQQYQDRLFKKFSQVDGSSTRRKGGTGLGLSICKEMVERMQGEIGFNSIEGQGSSFYFTLPLANSGHRSFGATT